MAASRRDASREKAQPSVISRGLVFKLASPHRAAAANVVTARAAVAHALSPRFKVLPLSAKATCFAVIPMDAPEALSSAAVQDWAARLKEEKCVVDVELAVAVDQSMYTATTARRATAVATPFDPRDRWWPLRMMRVPEAWELSRQANRPAYGEGVKIAHPDTGYTHHRSIWSDVPSANKLLLNEDFDFLGGDEEPIDELWGAPLQFPGHGTATASVAVGGPGIPDPAQVTGSAPRARLASLRVATSVVHFLDYVHLTRAIHHAVERGHDVISMSLGGYVYKRYLEDAVNAAVDKGLIVIAATGQPVQEVVYPAALPRCIAVGAVGIQERYWGQAARGPAVAVAAPGVDVWTAHAYRGSEPDEVHTSSGTSFAAAMTAGVAALWLAHHGKDRLVRRFGLSQVQAAFKKALMMTARKPVEGWPKKNFGAGIVNAEALLRLPLESVPL